VATERTLVDSTILIDLLTENSEWFEWSSAALTQAAQDGLLLINPLIYAEVSIRFSRIEDLDDALPPEDFIRTPLPWSAAFLAGKSFVDYRHRGGTKTAPLPDFYIGAHAAVAKFSLLTRDAVRYRTYFPTVKVIAPDHSS
jgi:predicted nucleic acid-binding protein